MLSEVFPPRVGGSGRWLWDTYSRQRLDRVVVAAGNWPGADEFDSKSGVETVRLPIVFPDWSPLRPAIAMKYLRASQEVYSLVKRNHCEEIHVCRAMPEGLIAYLVKARTGIPYTCYVHGEEINLVHTSRILSRLSRVVYNNARQYIVNSSNSGKVLQSTFNVAPEKVAVLHPGVNTLHFRPLKLGETDKRSFFNWQDRTVLLSIGRLQKRKGHDIMIQALPAIRNAVPNILFAIVGEGEEKETLHALVRQNEVEEQVAFLGSISDDELPDLYRSCDLFTLPNRVVGGDFEGFGIVLLEAQACGKAILVGKSGGVGETFVDGKTGLSADCTNPSSLAEAVCSMLHDRSRLEQMGRAAREWVVEQFDIEEQARKATQIFDRDALVCGAKSNEHCAAGHIE